MPLFFRNQDDTSLGRVLPLNALELYAGTGAKDLHLKVDHLAVGSTYLVESIRRRGRVVAYRVEVNALVPYNDFWSSDYGVQFERIDFQKPVDMNIHLRALPTQEHGGYVVVSNKRATVRDYEASWGKASSTGQELYPMIQIQLRGMYSVDAVKGFEDAYDLDDTERHFFSEVT